MANYPKRVVESTSAPGENDLWLNPTFGELKYYKGGEWKGIGGSGSDSGDDSGDDTPSGGVQTLFVQGTNNLDLEFTPDDNEPTFDEAREVIRNGGLVWLISRLVDGSVPNDVNVFCRFLAVSMVEGSDSDTAIYGSFDGSTVVWNAPASDDS